MSQTALAVLSTELKSPAVMQHISAALGKDANSPEVLKFIHGALMTIQASVGGKSDLTLCSKQSIINSLINAATVKLPVDNRKLAYLVPYKDSCTFMPSFLGYVYKIKESDPTTDITVGIVYKGDKFTFHKQDGNVTYEHTVANPFEDKPVNIVGAYCYMKTSTGSSMEVMSAAELAKVKAQSKMNSGFIWGTWEVEMFKKSMIRRAGKVKFMEAVAELDALDNKFFNDRPAKEIPHLANTAPLPAEHKTAQEAEVVQPTVEELEAKRLKIKEQYEKDHPPAENKPEGTKEQGKATEAAKSEPAKPQDAPNEDKKASDKPEGTKTATGKLSKHFEPKGTSKFHSYCVSGFDRMYFQTDNELWIDELNAKYGKEDIVTLDYTEAPWGTKEKGGINRTITGITCGEAIEEQAY